MDYTKQNDRNSCISSSLNWINQNKMAGKSFLWWGKSKKQTFLYIDLFVLPFKERKYPFSTGQKEVSIINKRNQQMLQAKH